MTPLFIAPLGVLETAQPKSMVAILDLSLAWSESQSKSQLARICAAAIGMCADGSKPQPIDLPRYNVNDGDVMAYGATVLGLLMEGGVAPATVFAQATTLMGALVTVLPTEPEVSQAAASFQE
jgi:hypothetical protein